MLKSSGRAKSRVNGQSIPGMIQTPMSDKMIAEGQGPELDKMLQTFVPMKRLGPPEEIANAVFGFAVTKRATSPASRSPSTAAM
jgi:NAD(P)-dependent dehydrogenase (short-subunit alcohol dehydrogenase family)